MTQQKYDRMPALTRSDTMQIHDASMEILGRVGVAFNHEEALDIFESNGFNVEGKTVFMADNNIRQALASTPPQFSLSARNPEKSVRVDANSFVTAPGYGRMSDHDKKDLLRKVAGQVKESMKAVVLATETQRIAGELNIFAAVDVGLACC